MSRCRDGVLIGDKARIDRVDALLDEARDTYSWYFYQRIRDIYLEGFP